MKSTFFLVQKVQLYMYKVIKTRSLLEVGTSYFYNECTLTSSRSELFVLWFLIFIYCMYLFQQMEFNFMAYIKKTLSNNSIDY